MEFRTIVEIRPSEEKLDYDSRILMLGSCFAENIGEKLKYYRFRTELNPCGIVYNPMSVANVLKLIAEDYHFQEGDLWENAGKWVSFYHHGSFSSEDKNICLTRIRERMKRAVEGLRHTNLLFITFGTSWVYRHKASGLTVTNCHRFPAADFDRFRLSPEIIVAEYSALIVRLREVCPQLKVVFTVSPIRHWKDGAHGNQLSKAVLLLAVEELVRQIPGVFYFPSYEIVMDELRDYRFYGEDMLHLSSQAVEYIWERFQETWISPSALPLMKQVDKLNKKLAHRPFAPQSEDYRAFRQQIRQEMEALKEINQNIDFSSE